MSMFYLSDGSDHSSSNIDAICDGFDMKFEKYLLKYGYTHPNLNNSKTNAEYLAFSQHRASNARTLNAKVINKSVFKPKFDDVDSLNKGNLEINNILLCFHQKLFDAETGAIG